MFPQSPASNPRRQIIGWLCILSIVLFYAALYTLNYLLPLDGTDYTSRIWNWSQIALTVGALLTLLWHRRSITFQPVLLGLVLAVLSALSHWLHDPSLSWSLQEGLAVWACFLAALVLFKPQEVFSVPAFQPPLGKITTSLVLGVILAIPLALINNLYFYLNTGAVHFQNLIYSAFEALSPAIHEEIIFRFFVLAFSLSLLRYSPHRRLVMLTAICLAVIPHSLNHLPDLFLEAPTMAVTLLVLTSILFGLPMAVLQIKRNLETAISFHWLIDFARFLFGF